MEYNLLISIVIYYKLTNYRNMEIITIYEERGILKQNVVAMQGLARFFALSGWAV